MHHCPYCAVCVRSTRNQSRIHPARTQVSSTSECCIHPCPHVCSCVRSGTLNWKQKYNNYSTNRRDHMVQCSSHSASRFVIVLHAAPQNRMKRTRPTLDPLKLPERMSQTAYGTAGEVSTGLRERQRARGKGLILWCHLHLSMRKLGEARREQTGSPLLCSQGPGSYRNSARRRSYDASLVRVHEPCLSLANTADLCASSRY